MIRGVDPSISFNSIFAFLFNCSFTISMWPFMEAVKTASQIFQHHRNHRRKSPQSIQHTNNWIIHWPTMCSCNREDTQRPVPPNNNGTRKEKVTTQHPRIPIRNTAKNFSDSTGRLVTRVTEVVTQDATSFHN